MIDFTSGPIDIPPHLQEKGLRDHQLTCVPHWAGPDQCCFVDFPFCDGKRRACVRVRRVPEDHAELRQLCQRVQDELHLKLYYRGESYAMLGHRFVHEVLVRKREAISDSQKQEMMDRQQQRCTMCRDLLITVGMPP